MTERIAQLRARMDAQGFPALLVTKRENVLYLSGFSGSSGLLIVTRDLQVLVSDFRYQLQAAREAPDWTFQLAERSLLVSVRRLLTELGEDRISIDPDDVTLSTFTKLGGDDPQAEYSLAPAPRIVEDLRLVKDPGELARIRAAVQLTDDAYAHVVSLVTPGITERELALEAECYIRRHGGAAAFDFIVAAGENGALPHAQPGDRPLRKGDLVIIDMGAQVDRYCADMTRTFAVGSAPPVAREIYRLCAQAQQAGIDGIRAGMTGREADAVVRRVIAAGGYGEFFGHGTGHGVGLEVHELPWVNQEGEGLLPAGSVITIEPGIYLPDVGGVRIEDLAVVTETGVEVYTGAPKPAELPCYG
ncbi:MAG: M24 family metallopeptidase [Armatimonadota bacterium]